MRMSMNEKKALYAFGCPNREATVERLRFAAAKVSIFLRSCKILRKFFLPFFRVVPGRVELPTSTLSV